MNPSNRDEALRCLSIAQKHKDNGNLESALKFCRKSIALFETKQALALLDDIQELPSSSSASSSHPPPSSSSTSAPSTSRPNNNDSGSQKGDPERIATVRRIRACKPTQYYEILGLEKSCSDQDIKKAFRKLAILTHPDKTDVEGAAEAFKMVGRAWQILGNPTERAQYDAAPDFDPSARLPQSAAGPQFRGGEVSPEELFNMFFGGGGLNGAAFNAGAFGGTPMFTASFGPNGFQHTGQRRQQQRAQPQQNAPTTSPLLQVLPVIILFVISFLGSMPSITALFSTPDPGYTFTPSRTYTSERITSSYKVPYFVNKAEFEAHPIFESIPPSHRKFKQAGGTSPKLRSFENGVERLYVGSLRNGCNREVEEKERKMERHRGFLGIGGDWDKVEQIKQEPMPSCQQLRDMGLLSY